MTERKGEKKYPLLTSSKAQKIVDKYDETETDDLDTLLVDMENLDIILSKIKTKNDIEIIKFLNKKVNNIIKQDISGLNVSLKWNVIEAILYFTFNNFKNEKELKDNYNNYKKTGNTDFITQEFKNAVEEYGNIDEVDNLMSEIDRGYSDDEFTFTPLQENYMYNKLQEQEKKEEKNKKIVNKILKDYPYLKWYITTIDLNYGFQMDQLKERMMIYDSPLSTPIKKILKYMGFYSEDDIEESKRLINLFHEHKVNNLGDLIKMTKFDWKSISKDALFNNNINFNFFIEIIAKYLYPKYKLNIDVNDELTKEIFYIKCAQEISDQDDDDIQNECTNKWGELVEGAKNNEELQQLYKDIYYGFDIPEAPLSPMPSYSGKRRKYK
jgi:hypothetical protein